MTAGGTSRAAHTVALALAFHRAPVGHPDLLHARGPLPAGIDTLLKLAGGSRPGLDCAALASPDELRAAALFFVEQVLLHHDADHYRVLGLEPGATAEQIKEHHRLLMRVFHPDRERHDGDWKDAFAIRINLAYSTLHDPDARRRYDATLAAGRAGAPAPRAALHARPRRRRGLPPWLARHLPQWVLAGTALVALAVVGTVYVSNPRPPAPHLAAADTPVEAPLALAEPAGRVPDAAPTPQAAAAAPESLQETIAPAAEPAARMAAQPARSSANALEAKPAAAPAVPEAGVMAQAPRPPATPPTQTVGALRTAPAPIEAPAVAPTATPAGESAAPALPAAAAPVAPPAPAVAVAPRAAKPDPDATLARFMASYERGDTAGLMALFDEVAIGNAGGKPQIRRAHETLFRSTELRHIAFENMAWAQDGEWLRGRGRYQATLMRRGEAALETEAGVVRIELLRRGDRALIMALDYQPGERS